MDGFPDFDRLLDGKVALITGSGSGHGRSAALVMARHGARVVVVDFNETAPLETVQLLEEQDTEGMAVTVDVSQRANCNDMIAAAMESPTSCITAAAPLSRWAPRSGSSLRPVIPRTAQPRARSRISASKPMNRLGAADEVCDVALLASDQSTYSVVR